MSHSHPREKGGVGFRRHLHEKPAAECLTRGHFRGRGVQGEHGCWQRGHRVWQGEYQEAPFVPLFAASLTGKATCCGRGAGRMAVRLLWSHPPASSPWARSTNPLFIFHDCPHSHGLQESCLNLVIGSTVSKGSLVPTRDERLTTTTRAPFPPVQTVHQLELRRESGCGERAVLVKSERLTHRNFG